MREKTTREHLDEYEKTNGIMETADESLIRNVAERLLEESAVVTITDRHGRILYANDNFVASSKYGRKELIGKNHRILNSGYHPQSFFTDLWDTVKSGKVWKGTIRNRAKDGSYYWVNTTIVPFMDKEGRAFQFVSVRNDITEKKLLEEEYRLVTENIMDLIIMIDYDNTILFSTPSSERMLGYKVKELVGKNLLDYIHTKDQPAFKKMTKQIFKGQIENSELEFFLRSSVGKYLDVEVKVNSVFNKEKGEINQLILVIRDISFRRHSEQLIHQLTHYDMLTGLSNRAFFLKQLGREIFEAEQRRTQLATIFIDLDRFKDINESLGPEAGDNVLAEVANRMRLYTKATDVIARLGGDEFAILLRNIKNKSEVIQNVQNFVDTIGRPIKVAREFRSITASVGIAFFPEHGTTPEELMRRANIASDVVKRDGMNSLLVFDDTMEEVSLDRILLENEMRKAVKADQFTLDYQPKFELKSKQVIGLEGLVRWEHPELGKIPPGKFIPVAEETGLIHDIGELVLRKGCQQSKDWQNAGYEPLPLSVNLSVKQFYDEHLLEKIEDVLNETGLNPKWLELEVTESAFTDIDFAIAILNDVRNLGINISIDDFGKGYSSFTYLKHLPVNILKIDRMFIQDVDQFEDSKAIVEGITDIAKKLGLDVIAEGIETEAQLNTLIDIGLTMGQGFYFSKPVPAKEVVTFLGKVSEN